MALVLAVVTALAVTAPPALAQAPARAASPAQIPTTPSLPLTDANDSSKDEPNLAERLLVSPREPRCEDTGAVGGITVCGKKKDNSKDRLPIPDELKSATDIHDGLPRGPDVMNNRITGHSISLGCGLGGCPRALLPDINFRLLPPAPAGSDADLIARGEIRGN
ncbi:hypothetical protein [Novosphingobium sp.]|uniref:hypothetical protein n=1 Tax=Novosphingobium sp. TaxID=1874826 RepID=UPI00333EBC8C